MNQNELEEWCSMLGSTKIKSRKEACDGLHELFRQKTTIEFLNTSKTDWWSKILSSIFSCMLKDHEKQLEDIRRKGMGACMGAPQSVDLFTLFVRIAIKEQGSLNFLELFHIIIEWLRDHRKKQFQNAFLTVLSGTLLVNSHFRGLLEESDWRSLFRVLKSLCEGSQCDSEPLKCLSLVIKFGPLHKFPVDLYRQQFTYIVKLCQGVNSKSRKPQQDAVAQLIFDFCSHTAKDNRMACCKLGEDIFYNVTDLYQGNANDDKLKVKLIEFFQLQVVIHNPKGVKEDHHTAYAASWDFWKSCLFNIYDLLMYEIETNLELRVKNQSLFICNNGISKLYEGFVTLFVEVCRQLFDVDNNTCAEPPTKRTKKECNILNLIDKIEETKSWVWINLTYSLIESYSDMISTENYIRLLKIFLSLQAECKEISLLHHVHKALIILQKIKSFFAQDPQIDNMWRNVADSTLRLINQNEDSVQELLQLLITNNYITSFENLFQYYQPSATLSINYHNLKTIDIVLKNVVMLQSNKSLKNQLINWILSSKNYKEFCNTQVAEILICLVLKQWPKNHQLNSHKPKKPFENIENLYFSTCFENLLIDSEKADSKTDCDVLYLDSGLFESLSDSLINLSRNVDVRINLKEFFKTNLLIFNVISLLIKYNLTEVGSVGNLSLFRIFQENVKDLFERLSFKVSQSETQFAQLTDDVQTLSVLFSSKGSEFMSRNLKENAPEELIRDLFGILNLKFEELTEGDSCLPLKKLVVATLVNYSVPNFSNSAMQHKVFQALLSLDYDFSDDAVYEIVLTLLHSIRTCSLGSLSERDLELVFDFLQKFCENRYDHHESVLEFFEFFNDFYPVVVASRCVESQSSFIGILYPFYCKISSYDSSISVKLLKCMSLLYELEPNAAQIQWCNEEVALKIPEFLTNNYQEVRFAAIEALATFFRVSSKTRILEQYHKQEIMFSKIASVSVEVLQLEGNENESRIIDEIVVRSSSILHTFASIMVTSNLWIEESLFTLLKIVCDKKLDLNHVETITELVAKKLGFKLGLKFLEKYLVGLVNRWKPYDPEKFPYSIFNCSSKIDLYTKYWSLLAHIFVENSENSINQIASRLGKSLQTLLQETCPKLLSYSLAQECSDLSLIQNNKIYQLLRDTLGIPKLQEIFKTNIEEIILYLIEFISDESAFQRYFHQNIIFSKMTEIRLTVEDFYECLQFITTTLYSEKCVMSSLMQNNPEKIHFILLQLNLRLNGMHMLEDKLRYFHLFSVISSLCVDAVITEPSMQAYLIRDLTHTLLHHIKNHKNQPELSKMSCTLLNNLFRKILPSLADVVAQFFLIIVSRLKYVTLENCSVSDSCVAMLEFLIVENKNLFISEIEKLDSIPQTSKFEKIFSVYFDVKYNNREVSLEDEIIHFLDFNKNTESIDECENSVSHLKTLLTQKKDELKSMYIKLRQTRGFSEDCKNSNLHKLICVLITLSGCTNKNVSIEAARCLGEIGPADLATLILQPEKSIPDTKWLPFDLVLGSAVSLLSKYLVDMDVTVLKAASRALFRILSTKEGRKVIESQSDFGFGTINRSYLTPFFAIDFSLSALKININGDYFMTTVQNDELWIPEHCSHEIWITNLVCTFLNAFEENNFFNSFIEVCKLKVEFCEQILPQIVYTVLFLNNFSFTNIISNQIETFFNKHWDITVNNQKCVSITTNKFSVQSMLNIIYFVRLQRSARKKEIRDLRLNYLKVAKAAHFCTAHFTALLYAELWCQEQINESNEAALSTCSYTKLDLVYEQVDETTGNALQSILRQAYKSVGETDALLGCGTSHLLNPASRVEHYKELGRWDQVTQYYERTVSLGQERSLHSLVDSLKNANLYQLSLFCSKVSEEPNYESLWRLGQWNYNESNFNKTTYEKCKFYSLKALHENEEFTFNNSIEEGMICVVKDFTSANMESINNFYNTFAQLQCLKELEEFAKVRKSGEVLDLLVKWKTQDDIICNQYQYVEPVQAQRNILLMDVLKSQETDDLKNMIVDTIIGYSQCARLEGNSQVAFRILENLRSLCFSSDVSAKIKLEEAQLCWNIQDVVSAKCILKQLCTNGDTNPRLHAMALKMTGEWMVESSSENRQTIIENYFQKSLEIIKRIDFKPEDGKTMVDTFNQLARFADHEYQQVMSHIKSDVFQKKKANMLKAKDLVNTISASKNIKKVTKDFQKAITIKKKQSCIDEIEIHNLETDKNYLLLLALKYYLRILIISDNYNMTVFRLFSLLLENRNNDIVKSVLEKDLLKIPTYKFVTILPQIIPHISNTPNDIFGQTVNNLIEKCAKDHPYHTLPLVLSLALSNKDRDYSESKAVSNDTRTQSAKAILKKLKEDSQLSKFIEKMEFLSEAIIELAYYTDSGSNIRVKIPRTLKIKKIQNYDDILLPTYVLPVDKTCDYRRIVGITKFSESYNNVGGINAPKRVNCMGTDGVIRDQLIKGQDDLRQDAVMQQVFTIMNSLLALNKQTKNLKIRTYKIVPLSMRSGILEWVDTMTFYDYLVGAKGDSGAHVKFRPMDKNPTKCRVDFKNSSKLSNEDRLRAFNKICENIKPVFGKFFETSFPQPTVWYERRRTYIHSVATSSMCGYILGIGDRHLNNILIDKNTADVVHIDFGIAFEQGRVLPTPETVPFRLTRDIVDGMGVSGVEGVFRRSCEKTVEVLRLHYQTIITILEVLLYDPLYDWTVSSAEANKRQKDEQDDSEVNGSPSGGSDENTSRNINETAERALLRLKAKLQGTETGRSTSVEHQVGTLIQQAVDPSNLSKLFHGWQPYL